VRSGDTESLQSMMHIHYREDVSLDFNLSDLSLTISIRLYSHYCTGCRPARRRRGVGDGGCSYLLQDLQTPRPCQPNQAENPGLHDCHIVSTSIRTSLNHQSAQIMTTFALMRIPRFNHTDLPSSIFMSRFHPLSSAAI
jgi:hypothetical protein